MITHLTHELVISTKLCMAFFVLLMCKSTNAFFLTAGGKKGKTKDSESFTSRGIGMKRNTLRNPVIRIQKLIESWNPKSSLYFKPSEILKALITLQTIARIIELPHATAKNLQGT